MIRPTLLAVVALVAASSLAGPAAAKVVEVPAHPVARFGNSSASTCQVAYFLQFRDVQDGAAWRAEWRFNGFAKAKTAAPPSRCDPYVRAPPPRPHPPSTPPTPDNT